MQMVISADNPGRISRMAVKEQHIVDTGDLLLKIDYDN